MPASLKQLVKILFETAFHAFPNMVIPDRIDMVGIRSFFPKAENNI